MTLKCEVVPVSLEPHPNADTLSLAKAFGFPVVVKTQDFAGLDRAAYIPVDALAPDTPRFAFLGRSKRIKARRLRGLYSEGLLMPPEPGETWEIGQDVTEALGVTKYDPPSSPQRHYNLPRTPLIPEPEGFVRYTDVEKLRRYPDLFKPGEPVVVMEKVHGANARFMWRDGQLYVGSHRVVKKEDDNCFFWKVAKRYQLAEKLQKIPGMIVFGEVFGPVQHLKYGRTEPDLVVFDIFDSKRCGYVDASLLIELCTVLQLPLAPIYTMAFDLDMLKQDCEFDSHLCPDHIKEGVVVRPIHEVHTNVCGRLILKLISERYMLDG